MKHLPSLACSLLCLAIWVTPTGATDLGLAPASYDWSGGYVGVNTGAAFRSVEFSSDYRYRGNVNIGQEQRDLIDDLDSGASENGAGFTAGVVAGYSVQMSNLVLGVEGDFNYLGFSGEVKNDAGAVMSESLSGHMLATDRIDYEGSWYGTFRGRVGYALNNVLVYGTGGLAYGQLDITQKLGATSNRGEFVRWSANSDAWRMGWTLGGGVEYAVDRWIVGLEYLYVDLGTFTWDGKADVALGNPVNQAIWSAVKEKGEADYAFGVARATLKYRF